MIIVSQKLLYFHSKIWSSLGRDALDPFLATTDFSTSETLCAFLRWTIEVTASLRLIGAMIFLRESYQCYFEPYMCKESTTGEQTCMPANESLPTSFLSKQFDDMCKLTLSRFFFDPTAGCQQSQHPSSRFA